MGRLKTNSQRVFRELLEKRGVAHCRIPGVSASAANRLYHGFRQTSPKVIDRLAKYFGDDGAVLVKAWLEDKATELSCVAPSKWKVTLLVE